MTKKRGVSPRLFDGYIELMQGYHKVDAVLKGCESVGAELELAMSAFTKSQEKDETAAAGGKGALEIVNAEVDVEQALRTETDPERRSALKGYIKKQPDSLAEGIFLKDYQVRSSCRTKAKVRRKVLTLVLDFRNVQLFGLNWLNLLHSKGLSCILADEMGLG